MAHIDRFIHAIKMFHAERLILASGQKVSLLIGNEARTTGGEPPTLAQIDDLLKEIVPDELPQILTHPGVHEFPYDSGSGPMQVRVTRGNGVLRVEVVPVRGKPGATGRMRAISAAGSATGRARAIAVPAAPEPAAAPAPEEVRPIRVAAPVPPADAAGDPVPVVPAPPRAPLGAAETEMRALFTKMVREGCSDLHLSAGNPPLFRKDGEIVALDRTSPLPADRVRELLLSITPPPNRAEFEEVHDTDFSYEIPGLARFRCNLFVDRMGQGGVFRIIPSRIPTVEELGLPQQILDLCRLPKGLVLVTGPTGSGKSTTLAAMIDYINRGRTEHIITIEDPIEFVHANRKCLINQREARTHTKGFKSALRAALREDPDIVLVGEMRDLETVAIAIETAETGHLVFGTLHTNTAPSTIDRIIDQFPADRQSQVRVMLSESLKGVISQTLCRKAGGGRVAALEILFVNSAVSNLIREAKTFQIQSIMQTAKGIGMATLNDALMDLVARKVVAPEEAYARSVARAELKSLMQRHGITLEAA